MKQCQNVNVITTVFFRPLLSFPVPVRSSTALSLGFVLAALGLVSLARAATPALVIVITIDQFRGDYLTRFGPHFGEGGFKLLLAQGASFTDAHHRQAVTKTAPGHAVLLSGVHPDVHGIIANDWLDRATLRKVNCIEDDRVQPVGLPPDRSVVRMPGTNAQLGASPRNFLATTVGDELKVARAGRSKVIAISSKDRSAILLAGKLGDAAYWMDRGRLVTSTYYMKELPSWVRAFNDSGRTEAYFGRTWERILPAAAYEEIQGPDDVAAESSEWGLARTFPKVVNGGEGKIGAAFYDAFECSPFKSEVLVEFARALVENENLGGRGVTDLLGLSFSANDTVGHNYGPDSHEVMDMMLRTDRLIAGFLKFIDERVGLKNCTILLTGDHGSPPLPERVKALNPLVEAGHIDSARVLKAGEAALDRAFGPLGGDRHWLVADATALLFQPGVREEKRVAAAAAEKVVREALLAIEFVQAVFLRSELEEGVAPGAHGPATLRSFNRERSADVIYFPKPFWVDRKTGTNHGTPYNYDTHVPLVWFGVGVKPGVYPQRTGMDGVAPTLSRILGIPAPPMAQASVLF